MKTWERGTLKPIKTKNGETIKPAASTAYMPGTGGIWTHNSFLPSLLTQTKPLLDRTNTPRGAMRATTIDRAFSKQKWLYNKNTLDPFNPSAA